MGNSPSCCGEDDQDGEEGEGYYSSVKASRRNPNKHKAPPDFYAQQQQQGDNLNSPSNNNNNNSGPLVKKHNSGIERVNSNEFNLEPQQATNDKAAVRRNSNNNADNVITVSPMSADRDVSTYPTTSSDLSGIKGGGSSRDAKNFNTNNILHHPKETHLPGAAYTDFGTLAGDNNNNNNNNNISNSKRRGLANFDEDDSPEQGCLSFEDPDDDQNGVEARDSKNILEDDAVSAMTNQNAKMNSNMSNNNNNNPARNSTNINVTNNSFRMNSHHVSNVLISTSIANNNNNNNNNNKQSASGVVPTVMGGGSSQKLGSQQYHHSYTSNATVAAAAAPGFLSGYAMLVNGTPAVISKQQQHQFVSGNLASGGDSKSYNKTK